MSIFSSIANFISGIFKPAAELVDDLHTSDEEKLQLRNKFAEIQASMNTKMIDYQMKVTELENAVRLAELKSHHWLAANWRPLSAILLVVNAVVMSYLKIEIPQALETLTNVFVPGYGGFRMVEKVTAIRKKNE